MHARTDLKSSKDVDDLHPIETVYVLHDDAGTSLLLLSIPPRWTCLTTKSYGPPHDLERLYILPAAGFRVSIFYNVKARSIVVSSLEQ